MKRKLKYALLIALVALSIFTAMSVAALAADDTVGYASEEMDADVTSADYEDSDHSEAEANAGGAGDKTEANFFTEVYELILENSDKILSGLSFVFSMLVMLVLRKGVVPSVKEGLSGIGSAVSKIKSESESTRSAAESYGERISELKSYLDEIAEETSAARAAIEKSDFTEEARRIRSLLLGELEMLGEILLSSTLPTYRKDSVSEKLLALKKEICCHETEE